MSGVITQIITSRGPCYAHLFYLGRLTKRKWAILCQFRGGRRNFWHQLSHVHHHCPVYWIFSVWSLKCPIFTWRYIFISLAFHCHVSFRGVYDTKPTYFQNKKKHSEINSSLHNVETWFRKSLPPSVVCKTNIANKNMMERTRSLSWSWSSNIIKPSNDPTQIVPIGCYTESHQVIVNPNCENIPIQASTSINTFHQLSSICPTMKPTEVWLTSFLFSWQLQTFSQHLHRFRKCWSKWLEFPSLETAEKDGLDGLVFNWSYLVPL